MIVSDDEVMRVLRERLSIKVDVSCQRDRVEVKVTLSDDGSGYEITSSRDADTVTIYQSDIQ